jgi:hypothetical protein
MPTMADDQRTDERDPDDEHDLERERVAAAAVATKVDDDVDDNVDDDADAAPSSGPPAWVLIALAVWGVVMLGIAVWSLLRANDVESARDDRREAASVAGEFAVATASYDYRDLEGSVDAVTSLATAEFAEKYQDAFFEELQPVVDELQARGRVHVRDVFISDISDDSATAVVSFDAVIRSTIGTRRLSGSYVRVDLVKEGGEWKADKLTFLATTQEGLDPIGGGAGTGTGTGTTATTAPATATTVAGG